MEVKVFGKVIGFAEDWDELGVCEVVFYNFQSVGPAFMWANGVDLTVNFVDGTFGTDTEFKRADWQI